MAWADGVDDYGEMGVQDQSEKAREFAKWDFVRMVWVFWIIRYMFLRTLSPLDLFFQEFNSFFPMKWAITWLFTTIDIICKLSIVCISLIGHTRLDTYTSDKSLSERIIYKSRKIYMSLFCEFIYLLSQGAIHPQCSRDPLGSGFFLKCSTHTK